MQKNLKFVISSPLPPTKVPLRYIVFDPTYILARNTDSLASCERCTVLKLFLMPWKVHI